MDRCVIIAGETSGDQYGSKLMSEINKISADVVEFWGIGGEEMLNGGLNQLENTGCLLIAYFLLYYHSNYI